MFLLSAVVIFYFYWRQLLFLLSKVVILIFNCRLFLISVSTVDSCLLLFLLSTVVSISSVDRCLWLIFDDFGWFSYEKRVKIGKTQILRIPNLFLLKKGLKIGVILILWNPVYFCWFLLTESCYIKSCVSMIYFISFSTLKQWTSRSEIVVPSSTPMDYIRLLDYVFT